MSYYLGIDVGTTFTAAAVSRDGNVKTCDLGTRSAAIPSVVLLRDNGEILTGEVAERRASSEPHRVAREFKRRIGDPTPLILGGTPYSAAALTARLLRAVVEKVSETEGELPDGIAVTHPANWGNFKKDLLDEALGLAGLDDVATITEPEAAAIHYASQERIDRNSTVAVYDLGGGTFDAAVLRRADVGWQVLGEPQGIERLGGIDFDEAVFRHVAASVGQAFDDLDPDDAAAQAALVRLRRDCITGKEALSEDTDTTIPVLLPSLQTDVRLTRVEFEQMIRPPLLESISALERALRLADTAPEDLTAVLLVGGSSRIPLVAQLVGAELDRPVAIDAHPKHGMASGAAIIAAERHAATHGPGADVDSGTAQPAAAAGIASLAHLPDAKPEPAPVPPAAEAPAPEAPSPPPPPSAPEDLPAPFPPGVTAPAGAAEHAASSAPDMLLDDSDEDLPLGQPRRTAVVAGVAAVLAVAVAFAGIFLLGGDDDDDLAATEAASDDAATTTDPPDTTIATTTTTAPTTTASTEPETAEAGEAGADDASAGEAGDSHPTAGAELNVVGVESHDTLNLRSGPGVDHGVVHELAPLAAGVVPTGNSQTVGDGAQWLEVQAAGHTGWANARFLLETGRTTDITGDITSGGEAPRDTDMAALGHTVGDMRGDSGPDLDVVVAAGPTAANEVTVDVVGFTSAALGGERLRITARSEGGTYQVTNVDMTLLCRRGTTGNGDCS